MPPPKSPVKTYDDAVAFLMSHTDNESKLGSSALSYGTRDFDILRFRENLVKLQNPHHQYAVIHVAGTKGKGSTCAMAAAALHGAGLRVGLYTSPHLTKFTERIRLDGAEIPDADFVSLINEVVAAGLTQDAAGGGFRTVFEILTAAAFLAFARAKVDVAVIETGLGGRLDSTNVFHETRPHPTVSVITSIGFDHTSLLGNTIPEISTEKAGIVHAPGPVVVSQQPAEWRTDVERVIETRAREIGTEVLRSAELLWSDAGGGATQYQLSPAGVRRFADPAISRRPLAAMLHNGFTINLPLPGAHQTINCASALTALLALEATEQLPPLEIPGLIAGLKATCWPGRIEVVRQSPVVIVDGAHCPLSVDALIREVAATHPGKPVHIVCGFLRDKNVPDMLAAASRGMNISSVWVTAPDNPRALPVSEGVAIANERFSMPVHPESDPARATRSAIARADEDGGIVIFFGSLYLITPVKQAALET